MDAPDDLVDAIEALALVVAVASSPHPASEALNVPGEPRIVHGMLLNSIRFPVLDEDAEPTLDEALVGDEAVMQWRSLEIEPECHFCNVHDVAGRWRLDFSFHFLNGDEDQTGPFPVGVAGVVIMDTSRFPDLPLVVGQIDTLIELLKSASEVHDERWDHAPSLYLH